MRDKIQCPSCQSEFFLKTGATPRFCPICGANLKSSSIVEDRMSEVSVSIVQHIPKEEKIQFGIGSYQVLQSIGKGGMGEVFLAYDTTCGRQIALKRIRPDLLEHPQLHNRFLKEARITCQLTHPAIIPIYSIQEENKLAYYTMPFVEGDTLKQIIREARNQEKKGEKIDVAASIPSLCRIFLSICQAAAYAHSKGVLHRDLKPENIIVGNYGQVMILDWGLAKLITGNSKDEELPITPHPLHHLTNLGKVVGTVAYMAPERAMGNPADFRTEIYSLGVILYQILTLRPPFRRGSLKEFRQNMQQERLIDPSDLAPYRDVPKSLSRTVVKCLEISPENRYQTVDELIHDIENYLEGRSEWFPMAELHIERKGDWEFQENVLIAEHTAITRETEVSDWVHLMISKASFQENIKLEANVKIGERGQGIGFLLSIPEAGEREHLNDGYCLWLSSDLSKTTKLLRSTVEVMHAEDVFLKRNELYRVRIEKIENNIHFYLNDQLQFSYISHMPLVGTHVGLLARDVDFELSQFTVYAGSQNVTVNCLAVPDAFLAHKDYNTALHEYRRIGYSFPGRAEGREAMFRAGITLLEHANDTKDPVERAGLYDAAQEEFSKLHKTPGAPLEYLGKALVYQAAKEYEEEVKCFELAFLRYPKHPLLPVLQEQIVYRMHESSLYHRKATFNFLLLAIRYLPNILTSSNTRKLFNSLEKHWEHLFFFETDPELSQENVKRLFFGIKLSFWLAKPYVMIEFLHELANQPVLHMVTFCNALFSLIELGSWSLAERKLKLVASDSEPFHLIKIAIMAHSVSLDAAVEEFLKLPPTVDINKGLERLILHLIETSLDLEQTSRAHALIRHISSWKLSPEAHLRLQCFEIWAFLFDKNWKAAGEILHSFPIEFLSQETSALHFLYGCLLYMTEGKDIALIHFSGLLDVSYPRTWTLLSHYIKNQLEEEASWVSKAFMWEKRQLYRQLHLFYHCIGNDEKSKRFQELAKNESVHAEI